MPSLRTTARAYARARESRRAPTRAEAMLWSRLRGNQVQGVSFRRQHAIGPYVVDFCAPKFTLTIELDGSLHKEQAAYDADRTAYLNERGYRVLRFWNGEVERDLDGVIARIFSALRLAE